MKIKQNEKSTFIYERGVLSGKYISLVAMGKIRKKMADYRNHQRFTIKCLKNEIIQVSFRLRTNVKPSKGLQIIRRAEKQLLNEHIRSFNNTLELLMLKRDTCSQELKDILDKEEDQKTFEDCSTLIKRVIECRHNRVWKDKSRSLKLYSER